MKQMILTLLLVVVTMTAAGQETKRDSVNQRFFDAKVRELVYRLQITDEQKAKFVPVYRNYNDEMRAAWGGGQFKGKKGNKKDGKKADKREQAQKATSAEVAKNEKLKIERQQRVQNVQMKYIDEFAKILDAKQMKRFFEVENKIQKKLMERRAKTNGRFGKKMGARHGKSFEKKQKKD